MSDTDLELLARYARHRAEDAFAEVVRRHVDLVYSAARRQVRAPELAEEVAQAVFADLAGQAGRLPPRTVLAAWLYQVTRRTAIDVVRREASRRLRERVAHELHAMNATAEDCTHIEPLLDEAMHALDETDRAAVLLRYFENKPLREVGLALGTSDDAAQKRVSRAVERLREFFAKHGVTVGASGLVVVLSANAVQAAPVGLALTISTTVLAGATLTTTATATATKAIAMTTLQKTLIATTLVAAVGTGVYEARQAAVWRQRAVELHDQAGEQIQQAQRERDDAVRQLAARQSDRERLGQATAELLKLRGEMGLLRQQNSALAKSQTVPAAASDPAGMSPGFGTLGDYLPTANLSDAGNATGEALLQTLLWAVWHGDVKRLESIGAPFGGQSEPGDVVGEIASREAAVFQMLRGIVTNSAGFRLAAKPMPGGKGLAVRVDATPRPESKADALYKNANFTFYLEPRDAGWEFASPPGE